MPIPQTSQLPPPKSLDEFEDIVLEVYRRQSSNSNFERYGRNGQRQNGVDIYCQSEAIAIQCKCCNNAKLDIKAIKSEIKKASSFEHPISRYIIATTNSRDTKIQDYVFNFNKDPKLQNKFSIQVVFWEDICIDLTNPDFEDILHKYYPHCRDILKENKISESLRLLKEDIEKACKFLKKIQGYDKSSYSFSQYKSCLGKNRDTWESQTERIYLRKFTNKEIIESLEQFYEEFEYIENFCEKLFELESKFPLLLGDNKRLLIYVCDPNTKPKHNFGISERDAIRQTNAKKEFFWQLDDLNTKVEKVIELGIRIIQKIEELLH